MLFCKTTLKMDSLETTLITLIYIKNSFITDYADYADNPFAISSVTLVLFFSIFSLFCTSLLSIIFIISDTNYRHILLSWLRYCFMSLQDTLYRTFFFHLLFSVSLRSASFTVWPYVIFMSRTRFRMNPHSIVAWLSRNSMLEAGRKSEV